MHAATLQTLTSETDMNTTEAQSKFKRMRELNDRIYEGNHALDKYADEDQVDEIQSDIENWTAELDNLEGEFRADNRAYMIPKRKAYER